VLYQLSYEINIKVKKRPLIFGSAKIQFKAL